MPEPVIKFLPTANVAVVSEHTKSVIRDLLRTAGCPSCAITSTSRTPEAQARAMYKNILANGVTDQLALYADAGDKVINEYVKAKKAGKGEAEIIAAMTAMVIAAGPSRVSLHCADPARLNVIDIAPSSIVDPGAFLAALKNALTQGTLSRFFSPGNHDPAFHIEVPQP